MFTDAPLGALTGYQLHTQISGGHQGTLELVDIVIKDRRNYVFAGSDNVFESFNVANSQMLAGLYGSVVSSKANGYLATFVYKASPRASGTFVFDVLHDEAAKDQTFLVGPDDRDKIEVTGTTPAMITVSRMK